MNIYDTFTFKGYDESRRYMNIKLFENPGKYWNFIYENKINNVILLENRLESEDIVNFTDYIYISGLKTFVYFNPISKSSSRNTDTSLTEIICLASAM